MKEYFLDLNLSLEKAYKIAEQARSKNLDPVSHVEIPIAKNMAERVEGLISAIAPEIKGKGIPERILVLEEQYGKLDWRVAFTIAFEIAQGKFYPFHNKLEGIELGIRTGFAYVTLGVVSSPLEGFVKLKLKKRDDNQGEYFSLFFSGPVRSAGGTGASVCVLIADYLRKQFGYKEYDASEEEINRAVSELADYHERVTNLQYFPSEEELKFLVKNLPVEIDGDPSEKFDVSNYKDLKRIETNKIRSGYCLVLGECLSSKAAKLWKQLSVWGKEFSMEQWGFLKDFVQLQKEIKARRGAITKKETSEKIKPNFTYISEIVAGRPVLTYPLRAGGFRLRFGRCRNTGLSSMGINPCTMLLLSGYIAIGTQLKVERPGKSTALSSCDSIEGPIVKLKNGDVVFVESLEEARNCIGNIEEIIFMGDILVNYGDFFNRAHPLMPVGYCEEWWIEEIKENGKSIEHIVNETGLPYNLIQDFIDNPFLKKPSVDEAFILSKKLHVPFHPRYTYHWNDLSDQEFSALVRWIGKATLEDSKILLPFFSTLQEEIEQDPKRALELLGVLHKIVNREFVLIEGEWAKALMINLGFFEKALDIQKMIDSIGKNSILDIINKFSDAPIKDKSGISIGSRMGRPEKAKMRKLTGSPHVLFPIGAEGGKLRSFQAALVKKRINADFPIYFCNLCDKETIYRICETCSQKTEKRFYCDECKTIVKDCKHNSKKSFSNRNLDIDYFFKKAKEKLNIEDVPGLLKGVKGTSNIDHDIEHLSKGILRATHELFVNKDGTIRFDMTELVLTHFKPKEIETPISALKELGYEKDIYGNPLEKDDQILELKVQDVVLPSCKDSPDEGADIILFRVSQFIDDLLKDFYGLSPFYKLKKREDLIGHLILGLAPHTSAAIVGRIIGFSDTQGCYAHPMWHCAMRRDADGDECGIMLLLDGLINFSRKFLPTHRGATQDAPLVLTSVLIPSEVDDMLFDIDIVWHYPLEFYRACEEYKMPWEIKIEQINHRLGKEHQYSGFGFTHPTSNINLGVQCSAYKSLPTMMEKVQGQMELAEIIRAVDESDVARLIIEGHFIRDIKGNLRKFSMQQFRCVDCNRKYRRPPLLGVCSKCSGKIIFTVSEGTITKYLEPSLALAQKYNLPPYLRQTLELTKRRIESVFGKDAEKQEGLVKWF